MGGDYFEDDMDPKSTTQGKTTTMEAMIEPDYDNHFTTQDAEKIKGIAARY